MGGNSFRIRVRLGVLSRLRLEMVGTWLLLCVGVSNFFAAVQNPNKVHTPFLCIEHQRDHRIAPAVLSLKFDFIKAMCRFTPYLVSPPTAQPPTLCEGFACFTQNSISSLSSKAYLSIQQQIAFESKIAVGFLLILKPFPDSCLIPFLLTWKCLFRVERWRGS